MRSKFLLFAFLVMPILIEAQLLTFEALPQGKSAPHFNLVFNRITNGSMNDFYKKLASVKQNDSGVVNIIHIGDSHIQPDFISSVIRDNLQHFFGNAGRGLVFPYQVARSNAPADIQSSSNISWQYNRLAHPEIPIECGIAGHVIKSGRALAKINFALKDNFKGPQYFTKLKFFVENGVSTSWSFESDSNQMPAMITGHSNDTLPYTTITMDNPVNHFTLISTTAGGDQSFYGVSLENEDPGVRVHTIGVNGARYEHYNKQPLFWQQLPALQADLVIVSLGTNESQAGTFNESAVMDQVEEFINHVKQVFPGVTVLVTTPQDSYKGRQSNTVMRSFNQALSMYCLRSNIALWDLYKVTNGFGSAKSWLRKGLLNKDRIHFTSEGYNIQGRLLYNAIARGYNDYINSYQNFK